MTATLRIFVSSAQKELEDERLIVQNLVSTDPFLSAHCVVHKDFQKLVGLWIARKIGSGRSTHYGYNPHE